MRILALSDIHGHPEPIQALVSKETARFDVVLVAGDIGGHLHTAAEILAPLAIFKCPIAYVYGNWDHQLSYDADLGIGHHLHGCPLVVDGHAFIGFSGCDTHWGANPIAKTIRDEAPPRLRARAGLARPRMTRQRSVAWENMQAMASLWRHMDIAGHRTVVVTHARTFRLHEVIPSLALHTFGHLHGFQETNHLGTSFVNVSAADHGSWIYGGNVDEGRPGCRPHSSTGLLGNYTVIELRKKGVTAAPCSLYE